MTFDEHALPLGGTDIRVKSPSHPYGDDCTGTAKCDVDEHFDRANSRIAQGIFSQGIDMIIEDEHTITFALKISKRMYAHAEAHSNYELLHTLLRSKIREYQEGILDSEAGTIWEGYAEDEKQSAYEDLELEREA